MADRIRYNLNVQIESGLFKKDINAQGREVTLDGQGAAGGIVSATTGGAGVALDVGDVTTLGWLYMRNLDATNFVTWGVDNGAGALVTVGRMDPGEEVWLRLDPSVTVRLLADTTTVAVQFELFND